MSSSNHFIDFPIFQTPEYNTCSGSRRGENQRNTLILFAAGEDTDDLNAFLAKILAAVNLDLQKDVLLLPLPEDEPLHASSIVRREKIETVIIFGLPFHRLGVHLAASLYQPVTAGSTQWLLAHSLTDIYAERQQGGKQKAGALWRALQSLFL
jgi:hypothetical protein